MVKRKGKTKGELHEEKKKELNESIEYLRQVDLPESQGGGSKFVREVRKEEKKEEKKEQDTAKNYLESRVDQLFGYRERLANYSLQRIFQQNFPVDWEYYCIPTSGTNITIFGKGFKTQVGILFIIKSPKGNVYVRGIKTTNDPEYDVNAANIMIVQIENTIDSEKGILLSDNMDTTSTFQKTKTGLYIPN